MNIYKFSTNFLKILTVIISMAFMLLNILLVVTIPSFIISKIVSIPLFHSIILWVMVLTSILPILFGALGVYKVMTFSTYAYKSNKLGKFFMGVLSLLQIFIPVNIYMIVNRNIPSIIGIGDVIFVLVAHAIILFLFSRVYIYMDSQMYLKKARRRSYN